MKRLYLDYNATAPLRPEAKDALLTALETFGNPSSIHAFGRAARRLVEEARDAVAALVGVAARQVLFTSGGSEANNLALNGWQPVVVGAGEHASVLAAFPDAARLALDDKGLVELPALERLLAGPLGLLSVQLANNETGVVQPIVELAALAQAKGWRVHCDAVQGAGRLPLGLVAVAVDYLSLSAHKLGGPKGVGALIVKPGAPLHPLIRGGGQELRQRAGTENVAGIAAFGAAARAALAELPQQAVLAKWRARLEQGLKEITPDIVIFGEAAPRLANTSCFAQPGTSAEMLLIALDLAGLALSSGAACSSGKVAPSAVLAAMGVPPALSKAALRLSLGWASQEEDVLRFLEVWRGLAGRASAARMTA